MQSINLYRCTLLKSTIKQWRSKYSTFVLSVLCCSVNILCGETFFRENFNMNNGLNFCPLVYVWCWFLFSRVPRWPSCGCWWECLPDCWCFATELRWWDGCRPSAGWCLAVPSPSRRCAPAPGRRLLQPRVTTSSLTCRPAERRETSSRHPPPSHREYTT